MASRSRGSREADGLREAREARTRAVWSAPVRVLHGLLIAAMFVAWFSVDASSRVHELAGYLALSVVAARFAMGLTGSAHARFADFVRGPRAVVAYLRLVVHAKAPRHLGHNPLGGWMVLALMATVTAIAVTGALFTTDRFWGSAVLAQWHGVLAWLFAALVAMHVAGVVVTSFLHRENLIAAMLDGKKRPPQGNDHS